MSGVPYIRFFGDDWLSGTQELSLEERGALVTIVSMTATIGSAPALDYMRLSRRFGCTPGKAKKVIQALVDLGKITIEDGAITNKRALIETEISQKYSQKQSDNASARWSKKTTKSNENNEGPDATALPRQCQPEPEPEPEEKREAKASQKSPTGTRLPSDWVLPKEWGDWALHEGWDEPTIREQAARFRDYWIAIPGAKGRKLDWQATFRNWMRDKPKSSLKIINGGQYAKPASRSEDRMRAFLAGARSTS